MIQTPQAAPKALLIAHALSLSMLRTHALRGGDALHWRSASGLIVLVIRFQLTSSIIQNAWPSRAG